MKSNELPLFIVIKPGPRKSGINVLVLKPLGTDSGSTVSGGESAKEVIGILSIRAMKKECVEVLQVDSDIDIARVFVYR